MRKIALSNSGYSKIQWRQIILDLDERGVDAICAVLLEEGACGVQIVDDETRSLPDAPAEKTHRARIIAPFPTEAGLEARVVGAFKKVQAHFDFPLDLELTWSDVEVQDWNARFKEEWKTFSFLPGVQIVPSWEEPPKASSDIILRLDPGMAFGTGIHETTQLCGIALQDNVKTKSPGSFLDVGTGSGILAILALKLGVLRAVGTDIDPLALDAARENAITNGVSEKLTLRNARPSAGGEKYPLVIANILAQPLIDLAPDLSESVERGGFLYLSGVLQEQEDHVKTAFLNAGFSWSQTATRGEWVRLDFTKT